VNRTVSRGGVLSFRSIPDVDVGWNLSEWLKVEQQTLASLKQLAQLAPTGNGDTVMKVLALAAALIIAPTLTFAQNPGGAAAGGVGGAAAGAAVGGPVGAVVGGAAGLIVGSTLPSHPSVVYDRPIVVGQALPGDYTYYPVPQHNEYSYIIVNNRRVIVDRRTHRVLRVIEED
jgi:hypothetical protein